MCGRVSSTVHRPDGGTLGDASKGSSRTSTTKTLPVADRSTDKRNHTQRGILSTFDTRLVTQDGSCGQDVGALWETPDRRGRPPGSDLKSHANDRLSDRAQAGVVVAGVPAHELIGVIDRDRFPLRRDPLGLFDNNP
jgi:hypothetical protein